MWAKNGRWILPEIPDLHVAFRDLLHAVNLRHGTDGFTSPPKEGVLRIFSPWRIRRLRPDLNPRTWEATCLLIGTIECVNKASLFTTLGTRVVKKLKFSLPSFAWIMTNKRAWSRLWRCCWQPEANDDKILVLCYSNVVGRCVKKVKWKRYCVLPSLQRAVHSEGCLM
jgi:hypothetical protein